MDIRDKKLIVFLIGLPALIFAFFIGLYIGGKNSAPALLNGSPTDTDLVTAAQFAPFWKVWQILDQNYVAATSTSAQDKIYGAIEGLAASYGDPYTVFFPPVQAEEFQDDITGNFQGVGMEIGIKNDQLVVVAPLKGSPAEAVGVKSGDAIMAIDGTSTAGMSEDEAVQLIRGTAGTKVAITFIPVGTTKPVDKVLTRAVVNIPTLETSSQPGGIFVISLYTFTSDSADLFRTALRQYIQSGDHKLIIDLRGNPGGYLDAAWDMASYFIPAGKVVMTEDFGQNAPPDVFYSKGYDVFSQKPDMIVLVDGGSASAAEILAGALQEQGAAELVGTKTFGKGSVQELIPITDDTSLKVTIARWLTPNGHNLSHDGLNPDYVLQPAATSTPLGDDPQMDKAVQLLDAEN